MDIIKKIMVLLITCIVVVKSYAKDAKTFDYEGHIYFNASRSTLSGERYLLNEQLSNIKIRTNTKLNKSTQFIFWPTYYTNPTPVTPTLFIEQAFLQIDNQYINHATLKLGRMWLPFGKYKNDLIYKSLAKALGQTNSYALSLAYENKIYLATNLYLPRSRIRNLNQPLFLNINLGSTNQYYDIGLSIINSLADSQTMQYNKGAGGFVFNTINSHVPGAAFYTNLNYQSLVARITYVQALKQFDMNELSYNQHGAAPNALSIQAGYDYAIHHIKNQILIFYDGSTQALALKLPHQRLGIEYNIYPLKFLDLQLEMFRDFNYASRDLASSFNHFVSGDGKSRDTIAIQAVVNF